LSRIFSEFFLEVFNSDITKAEKWTVGGFCLNGGVPRTGKRLGVVSFNLRNPNGGEGVGERKPL
jgi:hypothetical protein